MSFNPQIWFKVGGIYEVSNLIYTHLIQIRLNDISNKESVIRPGYKKLDLWRLYDNDIFMHDVLFNDFSILNIMDQHYYQVKEDVVTSFINEYFVANKSLLNLDYYNIRLSIHRLVIPKYWNNVMWCGTSLLSIDRCSKFYDILKNEIKMLDELEETKIYISLYYLYEDESIECKNKIQLDIFEEFSKWFLSDEQIRLTGRQCERGDIHFKFNFNFIFDCKRYNIEVGAKSYYQVLLDDDNNYSKLGYVYCENSFYFNNNLINHKCSKLYPKVNFTFNDKLKNLTNREFNLCLRLYRCHDIDETLIKNEINKVKDMLKGLHNYNLYDEINIDFKRIKRLIKCYIKKLNSNYK